MRCRPGILALGAAVTAALAPSAAHAAAPTKIGFDGIAANQYVSDQYLNSDGVQFGHPYKWGISDGPLGSPDHISDACQGSAPYGITNGINGTSIGFQCGNEVETDNVTAIHFTTFRRAVSFTMRSTTGSQKTIRVRTYVKGKVKADDRTIALPKDANVPFSITRPSSDITNVVLDTGGPAFSGPVMIDDLQSPVDDVPPPAAFELGDPQSLEVAEGGTASSTLPVVRYNGSSGPVSLSVSSLPDGIAGVQATPNPVTGTDPAKLAVSARPLTSGKRTITVTSSNGPAGEFVGGAVKQDVNIITALSGENSQASVVEACGNSEAKPTVRVRGGYRGRIDVEVRKLSGPATLLDTNGSIQALGDGAYQLPIGISLPKGQGGPSVLEATFKPQNATPVTAQVRVFDYHVTMGNASSSWGKIPEYMPIATGYKSIGFGNGGDRFTVEGRFPEGCTPEFQDGAGRPLDVISMDGGSDKVGKVTLKLPKDPVSGYISANFGGQRLDRTANRLDLLGFRNDPSLRWANSGANAGTTSFTWDDFVSVVGKDDAYDCGLFGCDRDDVAVAYWKQWAASLATNSGLCFGYATMALRFDRGIESPATYTSGAKLAYDLVDFGDTRPLKKAVVRWQESQFDKGWQDLRKQVVKNKTAAEFKQQVADQLTKNDAAVIRLVNGSSGHAVTAYDMRDRTDGGYEILTYNPNRPYAAGEESDKPTLDKAIKESIITVDKNGNWKGGIWSGATPWSGTMTSIGVFDRLPPDNASLGTGDNDGVASVTGAPDASGQAPQISSIRSGGDEVLNPDGTVKSSNAGVTAQVPDEGARSDVRYELDAGRSYTLGVAGGTGAYSQSLLSGSVAATVSGVRGAGQTDAVTVTPGQAQVGLRKGSASPATLDLVARKGKVTRTASVTVTGARGAGDTVAFSKDRGTLTLAQTGAPSTVSVSLGSSGEGVPAGATTAPIKLGTGQRLELKPGSWKTPAAGVGLVIRNTKGKVVRTGRAALKASTAVAFGGALTAKLGGGGKVTVNGTVAKPGAAPTLAVTVEALKGGKVVKKATALETVKAGAFSVPVTIKGMPKGAKVRVTATLVDRGAGNATARRVVNAR